MFPEILMWDAVFFIFHFFTSAISYLSHYSLTISCFLSIGIINYIVTVVIKVTNTFLSRLIQGTTMVLDSYNVSNNFPGYFHQFLFKQNIKMQNRIQIKHFGSCKGAVNIECARKTWNKPLILFGLINHFYTNWQHDDCTLHVWMETWHMVTLLLMLSLFLFWSNIN